MFLGNFEHTIDEKNRLSVPSSFRQVIQGASDDRVSITRAIRGSVPCLEVYPFSEWFTMVEELSQLPRFDQRAKDVQTYIVGNAHECAMDKQGRILIAPSLRQYADLQKDVVLSGEVRRFCIWNNESWLKFNQEMGENVKRDPQYLYVPNP